MEESTNREAMVLEVLNILRNKKNRCYTSFSELVIICKHIDWLAFKLKGYFEKSKSCSTYRISTFKDNQNFINCELSSM